MLLSGAPALSTTSSGMDPCNCSFTSASTAEKLPVAGLAGLGGRCSGAGTVGLASRVVWRWYLPACHFHTAIRHSPTFLETTSGSRSPDTPHLGCGRSGESALVSGSARLGPPKSCWQVVARNLEAWNRALGSAWTPWICCALSGEGKNFKGFLLWDSCKRLIVLRLALLQAPFLVTKITENYLASSVKRSSWALVCVQEALSRTTLVAPLPPTGATHLRGSSTAKAIQGEVEPPCFACQQVLQSPIGQLDLWREGKDTFVCDPPIQPGLPCPAPGCSAPSLAGCKAEALVRDPLDGAVVFLVVQKSLRLPPVTPKSIRPPIAEAPVVPKHNEQDVLCEQTKHSGIIKEPQASHFALRTMSLPPNL